jgi:Glycosyl hydrolases family 28
VFTVAMMPRICEADAIVDQLSTYPAPQGIELNSDFTVKARMPGKEWQDVATYLVKVAQVLNTKTTAQNTSIAYFDFSGTVEVSITSNRSPVELSRIRPLSYGIRSEVKGNTITFMLTQPRNLSVEINGDIFHNLQLFANPIDRNPPNPKDPNVIYFDAGVHVLPNGVLAVPSGMTVYIAGGAVLQGQVLISGVENVRIVGSGMLEQTGGTRRTDGKVRIANSKNIEVSGIIAKQFFTGGSQNVLIKNAKCFSFESNGDGMNVISSTDVVIDGVFNRTSDDCVTVYGKRLGFIGGAKNVTVENSTLWADVAHPILVGTHGDTANPEVLEDLKFINLDILDQKEAQLDYQGCMSLNAGDSNLIRNVRFENVRVEDFREGQLLNLRVFFNRKYCTSPGRGIEDVLFKDISYNGSSANPSIIAGYDDQRSIKNVVFENLRINDRVIADDMPGKPGFCRTGDMARIFVGEHVEGLVFRAGPSKVETDR